jgi:hypothetical protein
MKYAKCACALAAAMLATGCATIVNERTQPIKVETLAEDGKPVTGADCTLHNNFATVTMKSGSTAKVHRSSLDLDITCKDAARPEAVARAVSRANAGMAGNIILGGVIGAVIDHRKGTAYTYPTWMQLQFGKTLVFDRSAESDGMPVPGVDPMAKAASK